MAKIIVTEFVSLDGVMEAPGGDEGFSHGGWSFEFDRGDEGDKFKLDEAMDADALLLGRVTYEGFADAWPQRDGEFADKFNHDAQVRRLLDARPTPPGRTRPCSRATSARRSRGCKEEQDGDVVVHGSAQLVQALLEPTSSTSCG